MFVANAPALLAELNGEWSTPEAAALARVTQPVLIVSGDSSPAVFRAVDSTLAEMFGARHEIIGGGHLVNPASPVVLEFLEEIT